MTASERLDAVFVLLVVVPSAILMGQLLPPVESFYASALPEGALITLASLSKLVFLAVIALFAWKNVRRFERDNPIRPAWILLALGALSFFLGQLSLAPYQIVLRIPIPFPSLGDVFFLGAYPLYIASLIAFLRAYEAAGFPVGTPAERWRVGLGMAAACAVLGFVILRPIVQATSPGLEKFLNIAYPVLDFVVLIPTVLLLLLTLRFRGGEVGRIWLAILVGFVFSCLGDILFAYLAGLAQQHLDPVVDTIYILSYACLARGVMYQYELLTS